MTPKEASANLRKLPDATKVAAQQVMDVTAFQVMSRAKSLVPVSTGVLKRGIQWKSRPATVSAVVGVTESALYGRFDPFYWKFVEYGTVRVPARPFMRPAAQAAEGDHERRLNQALTKSATKTLSTGFL